MSNRTDFPEEEGRLASPPRKEIRREYEEALRIDELAKLDQERAI
jgi:hypothetical protein